jgi:AraC-like DNA-binding protein
MDIRTTTESFTHIVIERDRAAIELFGPSFEFLVAPQPNGEAPCVIKGTIPPGASVPIHRHPTIEACSVLSGNVEVLTDQGGENHWIAASPGDFIEISSNAKHGFRNRSQHPAVLLITINSELGRLFREIGRPITPSARLSPPSPEELQRIVKTCERYGYWVAIAEENASAGISLFMSTRFSLRRLVRDARYELAKHYLLDPSLDLAETAYLLGYEDPNSFFRAFREWEGTTPSERRAAQRGRSVQNEQSRLARPIRQLSA